MKQGIGPKEAVRLAREQLGNVTAQELADYIKQTFGLTILPPIVSVILGTLQERAALESSGRAAQERIKRWKAENPEEAKRQVASARRREAARRKKATEKPAKEQTARGVDIQPGKTLSRSIEGCSSMDMTGGTVGKVEADS
jgi:hypothetical protein